MTATRPGADGASTHKPYAVDVFGKRQARPQRASPEARHLARFRRLIGLPLDEAQALAEERGVVLRDFPDDHEGDPRAGLTADFARIALRSGPGEALRAASSESGEWLGRLSGLRAPPV